MTSTILAKISRQDLLDISSTPSASIADVKHLSSYNWIEATTPTIAVPGSPALWSPPRALPQLKKKKDWSLINIAQNVARHPHSPLEPLFRALYITNPSFDIRSIDVVTDRKNIWKLLSFVNPRLTHRNGLGVFTINIEMAKNTAIFSGAVTTTHEWIKPVEFRGFGNEFEKAYTISQISGSTGHHRIISYRFGGLNFMIRHETDGYIETRRSKEPEDNRSVSSMLESMSLSSTNSSSHPTLPGSKLAIQEEGQAVALESTLEIKTRVFHKLKPIDIQELAPQLWISQTPKLVRAYHRKGKFKQPEVENVAAQIRQWEDGNQTDLRKLATLIKKILIIVRGYAGAVKVRYDVWEDELIVWKVDTEEQKVLLPKDLYSKWDDEDYNSEAAKAEKTRAKTNGKGVKSAGAVVEPVDERKTTKVAEVRGIIGFGSRDAKGEQKAAEIVKEGE